jgi:hypothetical protein
MSAYLAVVLPDLLRTRCTCTVISIPRPLCSPGRQSYNLRLRPDLGSCHGQSNPVSAEDNTKSFTLSSRDFAVIRFAILSNIMLIKLISLSAIYS